MVFGTNCSSSSRRHLYLNAVGEAKVVEVWDGGSHAPSVLLSSQRGPVLPAGGCASACPEGARAAVS